MGYTSKPENDTSHYNKNRKRGHYTPRPTDTTPRLGRGLKGANCPRTQRHFFQTLYDERVVKVQDRPSSMLLRRGSEKLGMTSLFWILGKTCWTECTKTCGGGTQVTCANNTVVTRACNTIRCPGERFVTFLGREKGLAFRRGSLRSTLVYIYQLFCFIFRRSRVDKVLINMWGWNADKH